MPQLGVNSITFDHYQSRQTRAAEVFLALPTEQIKQFEEIVLNPMVEAEMDPTGARYVSVVIVAHSDRQDAPGFTDEGRRRDEFQVSSDRAQDALQWLGEQFQNELQIRGGTLPAGSWSDAKSVAAIAVAAGAGHLIHWTPGNDEAKRLENRRVQFIVTAFPKFSPA